MAGVEMAREAGAMGMEEEMVEAEMEMEFQVTAEVVAMALVPRVMVGEAAMAGEELAVALPMAEMEAVAMGQASRGEEVSVEQVGRVEVPAVELAAASKGEGSTEVAAKARAAQVRAAGEGAVRERWAAATVLAGSEVVGMAMAMEVHLAQGGRGEEAREAEGAEGAEAVGTKELEVAEEAARARVD